ncbi:unnamed protein product [Amoebophrya sp. A25]|nr:unnamed protein product [Amoebophrya sp. A25]|eukprot:GSA25T00007752001.1
MKSIGGEHMLRKSRSDYQEVHHEVKMARIFHILRFFQLHRVKSQNINHLVLYFEIGNLWLPQKRSLVSELVAYIEETALAPELYRYFTCSWVQLAKSQSFDVPFQSICCFTLTCS